MKLIRQSLLFGLVLATLASCSFGIYSYRLKRSADAVVRVAYELSRKEQPATLLLSPEFFLRPARPVEQDCSHLPFHEGLYACRHSGLGFLYYRTRKESLAPVHGHRFHAFGVCILNGSSQENKCRLDR